MSARTPAAAAAAGNGRVDLVAMGAPLRPQVNLLPPEVRSRRALGRVKVRLAIALLTVLVAAGLGFAYTILAQAQVSAELERVQGEVQRLEQEQAQFAEVPRIRNQIASVEAARQVGTSTEVAWTDYLAAIQAVAPDGWQLRMLTTAMPSPVDVPVAAVNPLADPGIGSISFSGRATTLPDIAAWIDALESIPGFADAYFTTAEITDEAGFVFYDVAATVQVNTGVFALRYFDEEGE